ncbi:GNAT family N-acetyltransferase [Niallia taxi]|uniref:GNAT family N-acetyltransferase n=1 Tax=Niallia taxi TaxID=2499688 RepID=UPI002E223BF5|nr:GNAT family N-acetyltransferase [Niallia taxi]
MITIYEKCHKDGVIKLIMDVQNMEFNVGISVEEQPDILDIQANYIDGGGNFWVALNNQEEVVGSIGLQKKTKEIAVLKKFFVYKDYRGKEYGFGEGLYKALLNFAIEKGFTKVILDTPSVATRSHHFYEKVGFKNISKKDMPIHYHYPDRDSLIYLLEL